MNKIDENYTDTSDQFLSEQKPLATTGADKEKILPFASVQREHLADILSEKTSLPKRDLSAALDLVREAYEAIRLAEERTATAERYSRELNDYHGEYSRAAETRISALESRAEAAEARAKEAEEWLLRFHDAIVNGFERTIGSKRK